jgi:hypothetical protein
MITKTKIGWFSATFVLRHRWEKGSDSILSNYEAHKIKKTLELGFWASKDRAVGQLRKGKNREETVKETFTDSNLVNVYTIGARLIVCKVWVTFKFSPTLSL